MSAQWFRQESGTSERLRAVSAVDDTIAWASGNHGTFARTTNGGKTWRAARVVGADSLDFRDVEAFDSSVAYLLSIGPGASSRIYKTTDGGAGWIQQYVAADTGIFLDEFAFWDSENGIAVGDAIDRHLFILRTRDGGRHWDRLPPSSIPRALPGEGAFAASGSGITVHGTKDVWIGTGVRAARVYRSGDGGTTWRVAATPILRNSESSGIFSVAFFNEDTGVIVGGDYRNESSPEKNAALTYDGGISWKLVTKNVPTGFRSAVLYISKDFVITVGPSGSDLSKDGGKSWKRIDMVGYHAVSRARNGNAIWAVGERGRISRFRYYLDW